MRVLYLLPDYRPSLFFHSSTVPPERVSVLGHKEGEVVKVTAGSKVQLECEVDDARPEPVVTWLKHGVRMDPSEYNYNNVTPRFIIFIVSHPSFLSVFFMSFLFFPFFFSFPFHTLPPVLSSSPSHLSLVPLHLLLPSTHILPLFSLLHNLTHPPTHHSLCL